MDGYFSMSDCSLSLSPSCLLGNVQMPSLSCLVWSLQFHHHLALNTFLYLSFSALKYFQICQRNLWKTLVVLYTNKTWIWKLMEKRRDLVRNHKFINIWLRRFARPLRANNSNDIATTIPFPSPYQMCLWAIISYHKSCQHENQSTTNGKTHCFSLCKTYCDTGVYMLIFKCQELNKTWFWNVWEWMFNLT